jgi:hypothetical protein
MSKSEVPGRGRDEPSEHSFPLERRDRERTIHPMNTFPS